MTDDYDFTKREGQDNILVQPMRGCELCEPPKGANGWIIEEAETGNTTRRPKPGTKFSFEGLHAKECPEGWEEVPEVVEVVRPCSTCRPDFVPVEERVSDWDRMTEERKDAVAREIARSKVMKKSQEEMF